MALVMSHDDGRGLKADDADADTDRRSQTRLLL